MTKKEYNEKYVQEMTDWACVRNFALRYSYGIKLIFTKRPYKLSLNIYEKTMVYGSVLLFGK